MNPYSIPVAVSALLVLALEGFMLAQTRGRRDERVRSFLVFCTLVFGWLGTYSVSYNLPDPDAALGWMRVGYGCVLFLSPTSLRFASLFADRDWRATRWMIRLGHANALFFLVLIHFTDLYIVGTYHYYFGYYPAVDPVLFGVFFALFMVPVVYAERMLLLEWRRRRFRGRQELGDADGDRILLVLVAYICVSLGCFDFLPNLGIEVFPYGFIGVLGFVVIIVYTILRYSLYDIQVFVTRASIFLVVYFVALGMPVWIGIFGRTWLESMLGDSWWAVPLALSTVLASASSLIIVRLWHATEVRLRRQLELKEREATTDGLTGLLIRKAFFRRVQNLLSRLHRAGTGGSLMMIDLDHFKQKNDRYGHLVGDAVLAETARRLRVALRGHDLIGRYGGEEFIAFLPGIEGPPARFVAERVLEAVGGAPVPTSAGGLPQTVSIGLATFPKDGTGLEQLIQRADEALYAAKAGGRNQVVVR